MWRTADPFFGGSTPSSPIYEGDIMKKEDVKLLVTNTMGRKKQLFKPKHGKRVYMFVCGPTVYDSAHLGHARTYVSYDTMVRFMRYLGYRVFYIMNITDIDDKILSRSAERGMSWDELAEIYINEFMEDMAALNVDQVNYYARATDHIPEIIWQIEKLIENNMAYENGGNVYFRVSLFEHMGELSGQNMDELKSGARIEPDPLKEDPMDFVLWKRNRGEDAWWDSPWGPGRPGWHVEDTAITVKYFGDNYDLHGGAIDLIFPHHEAEIAIAESITGKRPFVNYWVHTGFLNVEGQKMSKSLGNFLTVKDVLKKYNNRVVRFFLLYTQYNSPIDFSEKNLVEAGKALERLDRFVEESLSSISEDGEGLAVLEETRDEFVHAMADDFNTREAIASLFSLASRWRSGNITLRSGDVDAARQIYSDLFGILGIPLPQLESTRVEASDSDTLAAILLDVRDQLRKKKDWDIADSIRDRLKDAGYEIEDSNEGHTLRKRE